MFNEAVAAKQIDPNTMSFQDAVSKLGMVGGIDFSGVSSELMTPAMFGDFMSKRSATTLRDLNNRALFDAQRGVNPFFNIQ